MEEGRKEEEKECISRRNKSEGEGVKEGGRKGRRKRSTLKE